MFQITNGKNSLYFINENTALRAWDALTGNKEAFKSIAEYEKAKKEYASFNNVGTLRLIKTLEFLY